MGVSGFFALVNARAPGAIEPLPSADNLRGRRLGIDAPVLLCRARAADGQDWAFASYLATQLLSLRELECPTVFVFDGASAKLDKAEEHERRKKQRFKQEEERAQWLARMEAATDWDEILSCREKVEQHSRAAVVVGDRERLVLKRLASAMGFAWCEAPGEGESFLASLQLAGTIDEVITEDSDALVCGARSIVRNFWGLLLQGVGPSAVRPQRVHLGPVLEAFDTGEEGLRLAAVLAGCDFAPKLRNVGLVKALKAVRLHPDDVQGCVTALRQHEAARCPATMAAFERAIELLRAPLASPASAPAATLLAVNEAGLLDLVNEVEEAGEPWVLRGLVLRASTPSPQDLVARHWLGDASP